MFLSYLLKIRKFSLTYLQLVSSMKILKEDRDPNFFLK